MLIPDEAFSDARVAETINEDVLADRFLWCKALGWLRWTGQRWMLSTQETVLEAVRKHAVDSHGAAEARGDRLAAQGWRTMLARKRLAAVLNLAKGLVERTAEEFDCHPDLLNTPDGVVDLRTGTVQQHDPNLLLTKITQGSYRPGVTHLDWMQALTALPDDTHSWFQARVGQAITGHPTPDGLILVCQGTGENGKSALLTDGLLPALGDYAAPASPKLLSTKEHSTERADLRGQRLVIAEELTENRSLDVTAIKQISDVGMLKARYVHKDNMSFKASHTVFATTNYVPTVHETDHGTWRRLAMVEFPFTFRKPGVAVTGRHERSGDPLLKTRLRQGGGGVWDAIVTWAVEGARRFYASGFPPLPPSVEASTTAWRMSSDKILAFWGAELEADPTCGVATTDLLNAFNAWMQSTGQTPWSKETFHVRFRSHEETQRHDIALQRPRLATVSLSRPSGTDTPLPNRPSVYTGLRFRDTVAEREAHPNQHMRSDWSGSNPCSMHRIDPDDQPKQSDGSDPPDQSGRRPALQDDSRQAADEAGRSR